jgi:uncharacterized protein YlxP (DUF503 family)
MFVGVARLVLQIPGARSLKDRRQVVKSFKERLRARLPLSVAEVGDVERHQVATLGLSVVARDFGYAKTVLGEAVELGRNLPEAVLADLRTEVLSFGAGGEGIAEGIAERAAARGAERAAKRGAERANPRRADRAAELDADRANPRRADRAAELDADRANARDAELANPRGAERAAELDADRANPRGNLADLRQKWGKP